MRYWEGFRQIRFVKLKLLCRYYRYQMRDYEIFNTIILWWQEDNLFVHIQIIQMELALGQFASRRILVYKSIFYFIWSRDWKMKSFYLKIYVKWCSYPSYARYGPVWVRNNSAQRERTVFPWPLDVTLEEEPFSAWLAIFQAWHYLVLSGQHSKD